MISIVIMVGSVIAGRGIFTALHRDMARLSFVDLPNSTVRADLATATGARFPVSTPSFYNLYNAFGLADVAARGPACEDA